MIKVKNLEKYFNKGKKNEVHVLNGIDVTFENRGLICILGESGSGKTTLLNTIGGLDTFASGSIEIEGNTFRKYHAKNLETVRNDTFGYIFQNYYLLQDYTVLYNVKLALNTFDISEEEKEERALYVLEKLDMLKYKKKLVSQLSGGQQQRVSIARALVKSPKVILADEPTGNLDEENTLRTMSILKNIAKDCLVILVSHEKRIARFFADRIIEIEDGKIVRDYENKQQNAYQRTDDGNIYLQDMECTAIEQEGMQFQFYQEKEAQKANPIRLNFAWKNGKLYIQNLEDYDVILAGEEVGCEMLDQKKPDVEMSHVEEFDFSLPEAKGHRTAHLSKKEIWKLAIENIRLMGKKQAFMIGILLVTAVMLTITLANFTNGYFVNKKDIITEDSHYVTVDAGGMYDTGWEGETDWDKECNNGFAEFCEKNAFSGKNSDIFKSNGGTLNLQYSSFAQMEGEGFGFEDFSYVSYEHLKKENIIYGRMPKLNTEVVVDKWLIDRAFEDSNPYCELIGDVKGFLNQKLVSDVTGDTFRIVGISDMEEPSIYMDQYKALGLSANGYRIATLEQLQAKYPGKFDDISLGSRKVLASEKIMKGYQREKLDTFLMKNAKEYKAVGSFPDDFGVDYVLSEEDCREIRNEVVLQSKSYRVYTNDTDKTMKELKKAAAEYSDNFSAYIYCGSKNQMKQYEKSHKEKISSRNLITIAAVLISVFMIYFMIKSNVSSRTEELTVYRLLGISKGSIMKSYLLEMILVTSYTVLPAVLITSGIIKFIGSIPSLGLQLCFPWVAAVLLIVAIYIVNLLISMIPVRGTLSQPPAALTVNKM
ncbi:MAG: ABC transporter ATP-binding protein/permease [Butyribacter sp.]|nr:ABC transporter ATP-binding protein/permease [bacterium]MDY3854400.1 ABC transporter ATP-binding protein/permease [Butyribacter sp.]